jgi:tetratricopeptide (TPR) repeat protein
MGRKRTGTGKHLLRCVALATCLLISACTLLERIQSEGRLSQDEPRQHLARAEQLLAGGEYEASQRENQTALSLSANKPPGDEALYNMGLIYVHPGNPGKDYPKAIDAFTRLSAEYPESPRAVHARILVQVIQESEKTRRALGAAVQANEKLKRASAEVVQENERLKRVIEQSTKVDIEIEEKKKERTR